MRFIQFLKQVKGDWSMHERDLTKPGFQALVNYHFGVWCLQLPAPLRVLLAPLYWIPFWFIRAFYAIDLPRTTVLGRNTKIGAGITIHPYSKIGDYCTIRQNVTIGAKSLATYRQAPILGNSVSIGTGAVILGGVRIGDGATLGPNVVVMTNIPAGAIVYVPPPKVMIYKTAQDKPQLARAASENR